MKEFYGEGPSHLVAAAIGLSIATYGLWRIIEVLDPWQVLPWLLGAAIFHDAVLLPVYSAIGLVAYGIARLGLVEQPRADLFNHIRVPAVISGLLLAVWFPLILELNPSGYEGAVGQTTEAYMGRWLTLTAGLFAVSLVIYAGRVIRQRASPESS